PLSVLALGGAAAQAFGGVTEGRSHGVGRVAPLHRGWVLGAGFRGMQLPRPSLLPRVCRKPAGRMLCATAMPSAKNLVPGRPWSHCASNHEQGRGEECSESAWSALLWVLPTRGAVCALWCMSPPRASAV